MNKLTAGTVILALALAPLFLQAAEEISQAKEVTATPVPTVGSEEPAEKSDPENSRAARDARMNMAKRAKTPPAVSSRAGAEKPSFKAIPTPRPPRRPKEEAEEAPKAQNSGKKIDVAKRQKLSELREQQQRLIDEAVEGSGKKAEIEKLKKEIEALKDSMK